MKRETRRKRGTAPFFLAMMLALAAVMSGCGADRGRTGTETTQAAKEQEPGGTAAGGTGTETTQAAKEQEADGTAAAAGQETGTAAFTAPDGSSSIELPADWVMLDLGVDNWFGAVSADGNDGMFLMQFPKEGEDLLAESIGDVIVLVESSYGIDHMRDTGQPEMTALEVSEAVTCTMEDEDGGLMDGYVVYGKTDFAWYAIAYVSVDISDEKIEAFKKICGTFAEHAP